MARKRQPERKVDLVDEGRARELAVGRGRRLWVEGNDDLAPLATAETQETPLVIHDLNGAPLFYDFELTEGADVAGIVRAAASPTVGTPLIAVELGRRTWDAKEAIQAAENSVRKEPGRAEVTGSKLVCYCYPKIGVEVSFTVPRQGPSRVIIDVADGLPVKNIGADEPEGSSAYSYYDVVVAPTETARRGRWERNEEDAAILRRVDPALLDPSSRVEEDARTRVQKRLIRELPYRAMLLPHQKVVRFGSRCAPHECFSLYAQETNVFCAVATGQMILDFYRWYYTQDEIAAAMGTGAGGTGNDGQVAGYQSLSRRCLDAIIDTSALWTEAKVEIDANRPVKSGIPGHARAVAGWMKTWSWASWNWELALKVYDPWPWNADICAGGAVVWEDWDAVTHTNFIYVRHRATECS
jgi:hypothetical protein